MVPLRFQVAGVWLVVCASAATAAAEDHLMRFADVHEDAVVFTYEGDLWTVPVGGGEMPGG